MPSLAGIGNAFSKANVPMNVRARLAATASPFVRATAVPKEAADEHCRSGMLKILDESLPHARSHAVVSSRGQSYKIRKVNETYRFRQGQVTENWGLSFVPSGPAEETLDKGQACARLAQMGRPTLYTPNGADLQPSLKSPKFAALAKKLHNAGAKINAANSK